MPFDLLQAASDLIAVDTVSERGNAGIVPVVRGLAQACGLGLEVLPAAGSPKDANLLVSLPGAPRPEPLLFVTHTDTVPPGPLEAWTRTSPWKALADGDELVGLGSADVKVDLCAKLLALERLASRPLARGVHWLGTYGEEVGLLGAKAFVASGRLQPRAAVCGEPSSLHIVHAHKGYMVARVKLGQPKPAKPVVRRASFAGKAAHSSTPSLGENAIEKALHDPLAGAVTMRGGQGANSVPAECVVEYAEGEGTLPVTQMRRAVAAWLALMDRLEPRRDDRFEPKRAVGNVGWIDAADGRAELLLDGRLLPGHDPAFVMADYGASIRRLGGEVVFERDNPAVWTDPAGPLVSAAKRASESLGLPTLPETKATNTEAAAFAGSCEAIVFGAGPSRGNAHCPNERTLLPEVRKAVDWYERLAVELCS
ncbi:MAG TPA: M20/M25/M40 family metallo-hydrolase [Myxococcales bacterium]|nr:M20/M25/M40 family metallo-hydrolase [Myxococcales bacterium]